MNTTKIITLTVISIVALAISLTLTQVFLRKQKLKSQTEGKIRISYAILFTSWVVSFSMLNVKSLSIMNEYLDIVGKNDSANTLVETLKTSVLFIGLTNVWLIILYYIAKSFSLIFIGKRNDSNEIENNNYSYFLMKGMLAISFIFCLMPVFELILRAFFPSIEIPFYR